MKPSCLCVLVVQKKVSEASTGLIIVVFVFQFKEMKKLFVLLLGISIIQACNNDSTTDATTTPATPENVNGNLPDSANSANLNNPLPIDSSKLKDSGGR